MLERKEIIRVVLISNGFEPTSLILRQLTGQRTPLPLDFVFWRPKQQIAGQNLPFQVCESEGQNSYLFSRHSSLNLRGAKGIFIVYGEGMENMKCDPQQINELMSGGHVVRFICQMGQERLMAEFMKKNDLKGTLDVIGSWNARNAQPESVQQAFISMGERIVQESSPAYKAEAAQLAEQAKKEEIRQIIDQPNVPLTDEDLKKLASCFEGNQKDLHDAHIELKGNLVSKIESLLESFNPKEALELLNKVLDANSATDIPHHPPCKFLIIAVPSLCSSTAGYAACF